MPYPFVRHVLLAFRIMLAKHALNNIADIGSPCLIPLWIRKVLCSTYPLALFLFNPRTALPMYLRMEVGRVARVVMPFFQSDPLYRTLFCNLP